MSPVTPSSRSGVNSTVHAIRFALPAFLLGVALHFIGFTDYDEVHRMFSLEDPRLFLTFGLGVAVASLGLHLVRSADRARLPRGRIHPGIVPGAALFGIGWAVTGACPGVVFAQLGEGKFVALLTLAGILAGNWIYGVVHRRFFKWDTGSCSIE